MASKPGVKTLDVGEWICNWGCWGCGCDCDDEGFRVDVDVVVDGVVDGTAAFGHDVGSG